ncbi:MAG: MFS transporter [Gammaproteobacteria bacterium]|nr:MFS transporter [Gammaproteobacteria bacterium]
MDEQQPQSNQKLTPLGLTVWLIAALFFLYEFFLRTFVGSLAPEIIPELHLTPELFAFLGAAYCITYGSMQLPVGILLDKFGVKTMMVIAALICAASTFCFASSNGFYSALFSRLFMGFGSAFAFVSLLVVVLKWFPHRHFGFFTGASQFIGTLGPILAGAPLIHMIIELHKPWRIILVQVGLFGIFLAGLIIVFVQNGPKSQLKKAIPSKNKTKTSIIIKELLNNNQVWFIVLYSGAIYVSLALLGMVWGTEFLITKGFTQENAAFLISCTWIGYAIGCPLIGAFSDYQKRRKPGLTYSAILGLIAILVFIFYPTPRTFIYVVTCFLIGFACAGQNIGFVTICEQVTPATKSTAIGLNNGVISLFNFLVPITIGFSIQHSAHNHLNHLHSHNFIFGLLLLPCLYLTATLTSIFLIKETFCENQD